MLNFGLNPECLMGYARQRELKKELDRVKAERGQLQAALTAKGG